MRARRIGLLFGMEDTFPWALINAINERASGRVEAAAVEISSLHDDGVFHYDLILDRISHQVPFYRTFLKSAAASGVSIVNNPFWSSADDKFFDNLIARSVGVAVPKTVLLPHKHLPPNTEAKSFRNMRWVNWEEVFDYLGWPIFLKPVHGGGWKHVYKVQSPSEFFAAYDETRDLTVMAQEAIEFDAYYRLYVVGRSRVRIMEYDPRQPHHLRYVQQPGPLDGDLEKRLCRDALALCDALGYDMNTVEFAVRRGVPYAIDFMNCAPDADRYSVGEANFAWIVTNTAEVLIEMASAGKPLELAGTWPQRMRIGKPPDEPIRGSFDGSVVTTVPEGSPSERIRGMEVRSPDDRIRPPCGNRR